MANVYVYNHLTGAMEYYVLGEGSSNMPYATPNTLPVGEFRGSSTANTLWTDRRAMESWNVTRGLWGRPIYVGYAFKRIWEGGHYQHVAALCGRFL
jgi:hypothetical protein